MKKEIFKILRCKGKKCTFQRYHEEPKPLVPCPKCGSATSYSDGWYIKVRVDGKRHIQAVGRQRRQAENILTRAHEEIFEIKYGKKQDAPLLSAAIEAVWQAKWKKNKDGEKAKARAEHFIELVGDLPLDRVGDEYVLFIRLLEERKIKDSTINRYRASLKTVLRRHKQDYSFIELDSEPEGRIRVLSPAEEKSLLQLFYGSFKGLQKHYVNMPDLITTLLDTGMRASELLNCPWADINFPSGLISIWRNKGDKPRSIPMTARTKETLSRRKEEGLTAPFNLNIHQVDRAWKWARAKMGLEEDQDFVVHALRHTCASRLVNAGVDLYTVKEWLGHSSIRITERYAHLDPNKLSHAASVLDAINETSTVVISA